MHTITQSDTMIVCEHDELDLNVSTRCEHAHVHEASATGKDSTLKLFGS